MKYQDKINRVKIFFIIISIIMLLMSIMTKFFDKVNSEYSFKIYSVNFKDFLDYYYTIVLIVFIIIMYNKWKRELYYFLLIVGFINLLIVIGIVYQMWVMW